MERRACAPIPFEPLVKCYFLVSPELPSEDPPVLPPWDVGDVPGAGAIGGMSALFLRPDVPPVFCIVGILALSFTNVFLLLDISESP